MSDLNASTLSLSQRRQNILDLQALALRLRAQNTPGVELWSLLVSDAVQRYQQIDVSEAMRCDLIVQDLALVILGPAALKYLIWFEKITPDSFEDPLVKNFFRDFEFLELPAISEPFDIAWREHGYAGKLDERLDPGLDRLFAADFRPALNDQTDNQIFHTFFYQFMAYVTRADQTIRAASVYHEVFDKGGSTEDHTAALIAIETGKLWRSHRDAQESAQKIGDWPALIQVAYGKDGGPLFRAGHQLAPEAHDFYLHIETLLERPQPWESLRRSSEYALIKLVKRFSAQKL